MPMAYSSLRLWWVVPGWQGSPHPVTQSLPTVAQGGNQKGQSKERKEVDQFYKCLIRIKKVMQRR